MNQRTQQIMEEYRIPGYKIGRKVYAINPGKNEYVQLTLGLLESLSVEEREKSPEKADED